MVNTLDLYKQQIQTGREQVATARKTSRTQAVLRSGGLEQLRQRQVQEQQLQGYEEQLRQQEKEVARVEQQVQKQQDEYEAQRKEAAEWKQAEILAAKGVIPIGNTGVAAKIRTLYQQGVISSEDLFKYKEELTSLAAKESLTQKEMNRINVLAGITGAEIKYTTTGGTTPTTEVQGMSVNPFFAKRKTTEDLRGEILRGPEIYREERKQQFYTEIQKSGDVSRYSQAGYAQKEAEELAKLSQQTQMSIGGKEAKKYLIEQGAYVPKTFIGKVTQKTGRIFSWAEQTLVQPGIQKFGRAVPEVTIKINNDPAALFKFKSNLQIYPSALEPSQKFDLRKDLTILKNQMLPSANIINPNIAPAQAKISTSSSSIVKQSINKYINLSTSKVEGKVSGTQVLDIGTWFVPVVREIRATSFAADVGGRTLQQKKVSVPEYIGAGLIAGAYSFNVWNKPVLKTIKQSPIKNRAFDVIRPIEINKIPLESGGFKLESYRPPQIYAKTTRFRETFGLKPREVVITKPQTFTAVTPDEVGILTKEGVIINKPIVVSKRVGSNLLKLYRVSGESRLLTSEQFLTLPKEQQYLYQKFAEAKAGGLPVSLENVPKILGKNYEYSVGGVQYEYLGRINTKTNMIRIPNKGQTISLSETATIAKKIPQEKFPLAVQVEDTQIYATLTKTKDVTKPFSRAAGKPGSIEGITFVFPTRTKNLFDFSMDVTKPTTTITKTEISQASLNLMGNLKQAALKTFPKPKTPKVTLEKLKKIPSLEFGIVSAIQKPITIQKSAQEVKTTQKQDITQIEESKTITKVSSIELNKVDIVPRVGTTEMTRVKEDVINIPKMAQIQIPTTQQKVELRLSQKAQQTQRVRTPVRTPIKIPIPKSTPSLKSTLAKIKGGSQAYQLQVRRQGKFSTIGEGLTKGEALKLGVKRTTSTLAQTFRLLPKGTTQKEDVTYNLPSDIFTKLKKPTAELEWVERRGKTLKRGTGEVPEIKLARRIKGRRNFL